MTQKDDNISWARRLEVISVLAWALGCAAWLLDISSSFLVGAIGVPLVVALFGLFWGGCIVFSLVSIMFGVRRSDRKMLERGCIGLILGILLIASISEGRRNRDQINRQWEERIEHLQQ